MRSEWADDLSAKNRNYVRSVVKNLLQARHLQFNETASLPELLGVVFYAYDKACGQLGNPEAFAEHIKEELEARGFTTSKSKLPGEQLGQLLRVFDKQRRHLQEDRRERKELRDVLKEGLDKRNIACLQACVSAAQVAALFSAYDDLKKDSQDTWDALAVAASKCGVTGAAPQGDSAWWISAIVARFYEAQQEQRKEVLGVQQAQLVADFRARACRLLDYEGAGDNRLSGLSFLRQIVATKEAFRPFAGWRRRSMDLLGSYDFASALRAKELDQSLKELLEDIAGRNTADQAAPRIGVPVAETPVTDFRGAATDLARREQQFAAGCGDREETFATLRDARLAFMRELRGYTGEDASLLNARFRANELLGWTPVPGSEYEFQRDGHFAELINKIAGGGVRLFVPVGNETV